MRIVAGTILCVALSSGVGQPTLAKPFRGALLSAEQVNDERLGALKSGGTHAIALQLPDAAEARLAERNACVKIAKAGLQLYYWIEVARCPNLADAHPEWMASLQGHSEWRRLFESPPPAPRDHEVVKTYPWVPILNKEPFEGQLLRVKKLLENRPVPKGVFLNDLQGAPSACGCGNHLCRWTTDYGKIRTSTPIGNHAAADFVTEVQRFLPGSQVIPVWTTECEEHDAAKNGLCAGVGCFKGICWKAYMKQLMPVAENSPTLGVLLPYKAFQRDDPTYGEEAGWIGHALKSFQTMPPQNGGKPMAVSRLLAVVQGWNVTDRQIEQQIDSADMSGANGSLVSYVEIEQGWLPKLFAWKPRVD